MPLVHKVKGWFSLDPVVMVRESGLPFSNPIPLKHLWSNLRGMGSEKGRQTWEAWWCGLLSSRT